MTSRDVAYSLFGGPLILDVGPGLNGQIIRVRVQPINTISVTALVISLLLFITFMWFYLYPLFRARRAAAASSERARPGDAEQPDLPLDEEEKSHLLSWLHFRSRDRFSTHDSPIPKQSSKSESPVPTPPGLKRQPSSFTRGSLIPHLSPGTLTPPPPAYASRPSSPLAMGDFRFPPPLSSPRSGASRSPRTPSLSLLSPALPASIAPGPASPRASATPHVQFDPRLPPSRPRAASPATPGRTRTRSGTGPSSATLSVRPLMAPRRSVSANTLHPAPADLHVPSRARVYSDSYSTAESDPEASSVKRVARSKDGAGLGLGGVGLAARGRILTRGPSSGWYPNAVGSPF
ncbi:hypothetical protein B0H17DRAFT_528737 [Mycena rosella]|uniref:Uncharacterized protein n=1 Tax=Mycena rosella TaxID=1033263 RepID=A0AAD7GY51_MYCRO|nr:hypothetical protein B0H17DRAFT_528737 [Mycena rosella]